MGATGYASILASEGFEKLINGLFDFQIAVCGLACFPQPVGFLLLLSPSLGGDDIANDPFYADLSDLLLHDGVFGQPLIAELLSFVPVSSAVEQSLAHQVTDGLVSLGHHPS